MREITIGGVRYDACDYLDRLGPGADTLPFSLRVLAENALRQDPGGTAIDRLARRDGAAVPFRPQRLLLQDMLGLPLLVDVMALRDAVTEAGGDPGRVALSLPVDLVSDHSMTITHWAGPDALERNMAREFEVNRERFAFMKDCEARFPSLRVVPPGGGIMHQINLEHLGTCVELIESAGGRGLLVPDTNLGTDSHTPMINGLGVLGWGIGGLEAEAIMLGEATQVNTPRVVGLEIIGTLDHQMTATDIALTVAEKLRALGVVDCFVELFGDGYQRLSVGDRGTIANMAPEYGATCVFCPIDEATVRYLRRTGRGDEHVARVEAYARAQRLWAGDGEGAIEFDDVVSLELGSLTRSVSGPGRPEQRIDLAAAAATLSVDAERSGARRVPVRGRDHDLGDGDVVIAAITSCTNTANPRNMVIAGLLARNAVARGLRSAPHVKTSLAPGSRVVAIYLARSGLQEALDALGFQVAAFSCSTCNGMSGPLAAEHEEAIREHGLNCVAVLSGNRNFPGRIHPLAERNVLAAPPFVVAYAIAGTILADITTEPLGTDAAGAPVTLADLWPGPEEVERVLADHLRPLDFVDSYSAIGRVNAAWNALQVDAGPYDWQPSTYITRPRYLTGVPTDPDPPRRLAGLRPLVLLGDSITTDHISPSGTILADSAAGAFLIARGVKQRDFNSYGTRRGSSDVVIRSLFANLRLRNEMVPGVEGSVTRLMPEGREVSVFEAIEAYLERGQPLVVVAGKEYGCGSSRDTAAKAPWLAGVRAVVAESFERIHRSNLVNMGIVPLQLPAGVTRRTLGLDGSEVFDFELAADLRSATMTVHHENGRSEAVAVEPRIYNDAERETFQHGGLLHRVYRELLQEVA